MTERERLIELIKNYHCYPEKTCPNLVSNDNCANCKYDEIGICDCFAKEADYLLENGVIVPPCKVGDTAYFILYDGVGDKWYISEEPVVDVCTKGFYVSGLKDSTENSDLCQWSDVGDTVYFSKVEAEAVLKRRSGKMTCKDCLHCRACHEMYLVAVSQEDDFFEKMDAETCEDFKDKYRYIELPCKVGDTVYEIVREPAGSLFDDIDYDIDFKYSISETPFNHALLNYIGDRVFLTRKEAEAALKGGADDDKAFS